MPSVQTIAPKLKAADAAAWLREYTEHDEVAGTLTWRLKPLKVDGKPNNRVRVGSRVGWVDKTTGYRRFGFLGGFEYEHRAIWLLLHGCWPAEEIDHIDGDKSNNAAHNLREAKRAENCVNTGLRSDNKSGVKGVSWCRRDCLWYASIGVAGRSISLGRYESLEEAARVRKAAERKHHGTFARGAEHEQRG